MDYPKGISTIRTIEQEHPDIILGLLYFSSYERIVSFSSSNIKIWSFKTFERTKTIYKGIVGLRKAIKWDENSFLCVVEDPKHFSKFMILHMNIKGRVKGKFRSESEDCFGLNSFFGLKKIDPDHFLVFTQNYTVSLVSLSSGKVERTLFKGIRRRSVFPPFSPSNGKFYVHCLIYHEVDVRNHPFKDIAEILDYKNQNLVLLVDPFKETWKDQVVKRIPVPKVGGFGSHPEDLKTYKNEHDEEILVLFFEGWNPVFLFYKTEETESDSTDCPKYEEIRRIDVLELRNNIDFFTNFFNLDGRYLFLSNRKSKVVVLSLSTFQVLLKEEESEFLFSTKIQGGDLVECKKDKSGVEFVVAGREPEKGFMIKHVRVFGIFKGEDDRRDIEARIKFLYVYNHFSSGGSLKDSFVIQIGRRKIRMAKCICLF